MQEVASIEESFSVRRATHPKIQLQIPRPAKLPVPHLKRHCHLIILMQHLVEAFSLMRAHLYVVRKGCWEEAQEGAEEEVHAVHFATMLRRFVAGVKEAEADWDCQCMQRGVEEKGLSWALWGCEL